MKKKADTLGQGLTTGALLLGALAAFSIGAPAFGAGYAAGKLTSPREPDVKNLQKQYRLARLQGDVQNAQVLQQQEDAARKAKEENIRKTVYGVV